jgi:anti-sigma-K factor RskA
MSGRDQLSDYLLGELEGEERARFEAALAADPALAAEVERLRPVVTRLATLEPAAWEPAGDLPPLPPLRPTSDDAPASAVAQPRPRWWQRSLMLRPFPAAALAAVLLALGVVTGTLLAGGGADDASGGRVIALAPVEPLGGQATGTARFAASGERATVKLSGLPPSEEGEFYELWLLNAPDDLVSLGSFSVPASGEIDVTVPVPGDAEEFGAIDVSVEPADGDPAHSKQSVLRAPLAPS